MSSTILIPTIPIVTLLLAARVLITLLLVLTYEFVHLRDERGLVHAKPVRAVALTKLTIPLVSKRSLMASFKT